MSVEVVRGSFAFPTVSLEVRRSSREDMEAALRELAGRKDAWAALPIRRKIELLDGLIQDLVRTASRWATDAMDAKGLSPNSTAAWEEWASGPHIVMLQLRELRDSLRSIQRTGRPRIPGKLTRRPDGHVVARVFPRTGYDRLLWNGVTAEVWMQPSATPGEIVASQAAAYREAARGGKVALVLGAGNAACVGASDLLDRLFVRNQVVLYKVNPVNEYLGPRFEESFRALIEEGFLRIVYGGGEEGAFLCQHPGVDEIHVTGSDKTFYTIVFGTGPAGEKRKRDCQPLLQKPVTAELGNVSPVIVVPGPWTDEDLAYQAEHIASMLAANAGFNCLTPRVLVQHAAWDRREKLLDHLRRVLARVPLRRAYYPGAPQRLDAFLSAHPEAERFGTPTDGELPWALVAGVYPSAAGDICFATEAFCGLFSETALPAGDTADFIHRAVEFANTALWGTLVATILVHPRSSADRTVRAALDRAVADLRYGSVTVNQGAGTAYAIGVTPWGGFPRPDAPWNDVQSGTGFVHNPLMFSHVQKSVVIGPFRPRSRPPWFATQSSGAERVFARLVDFESAPSLRKIPSILRAARPGRGRQPQTGSQQAIRALRGGTTSDSGGAR